MKKIMILLFSVIIAGGSLLAKDIQKVTLTTDPQMHCANCEAKIKNFLKFEKGIKKIETSVPDQKVVITYDADKTSEKNIIDSFSKIKYSATKVSDTEKKDCGNKHECTQGKDGGKKHECTEGKEGCSGKHEEHKK